MSAPRILIVEDDVAIRQGMAGALTYGGFEPVEAGDGVRGLELALAGGIDLLLLDLVLPARGGLEILEEVRRRDPTLPVIIVTARGAEAERVEGLRRGADDYVVKPFGASELLARVEAVLRRSPERARRLRSLAIKGAEVDFERLEVRFTDGSVEALTRLEVDLLRYLAERSGRAVSRRELLRRVWNSEGQGIETRAVDMVVARLRRKLKDEVAGGLLVTVRGKGYKLAR